MASAESSSDSDFDPDLQEIRLTCPIDHLKIGKEILNTTFPANIDELFEMIFANSKFSSEFHLARKTSDMVQSEWKRATNSLQTRQLSFTVHPASIGPFGPKEAQVTETQTLLGVSRPGFLYVVESESFNAGFPFADCFSVNCHYCLKSVSMTETNLTVISKVHFRKFFLGKALVEKQSMAALQEFFSELERALRAECSKLNTVNPLPDEVLTKTLSLRRSEKFRTLDNYVSPVVRLPSTLERDKNIPDYLQDSEDEPVEQSSVATMTEIDKWDLFLKSFAVFLFLLVLMIHGLMHYRLGQIECQVERDFKLYKMIQASMKEMNNQ